MNRSLLPLVLPVALTVACTSDVTDEAVDSVSLAPRSDAIDGSARVPSGGTGAVAQQGDTEVAKGAAAGGGNEAHTALSVLTGCDPMAPFDPPMPAFTGSTIAEGLTFSPDEKTAFVSSKASSTTYDVYSATRESITEPFGALQPVLSSPYDDRAPSLSADGLRLYIGRLNPASGWSLDLAVATRSSTSTPFPAAQFLTSPTAPDINAPSFHDQDPFFLSSTNQLYFASERPNGKRELYVSTLSNGVYSSPTELSVNDDDEEDYRPILSSDGLTLYFASTRSGIGGDTEGDIWVARRSPNVPTFGAATNLYGLNTSNIEFPVTLSNDGCTLYFASNRDTASPQDFRLYQATRAPAIPTSVTTTLKIVGPGSVTSSGFQCSSTCAFQGAPDSTAFVQASGSALWTGSCTSYGGNPSADGVFVFTNGGVCTVTFQNGTPVGPGGGCDQMSDCQAGLECTLGTCSGLAAIGDTTVRSNSAHANFGTETSLEVGPDEFAVLNFDRTAVVSARGAGRLVRSARLEVWLTSGDGALDAYPMNRAWTETGATWTCAKDQDPSVSLEACHSMDAWSMSHSPGTWENPYDAELASQGTVVGSYVVLDVTDEVQRYLTSNTSSPVSWVLRPRLSSTSIVGSREGGKPARLVVDTVSVSDIDLGGAPPFSFAVDVALATTDALPSFADGVPRPLGVLQTSDGDTLRYVQNELTVLTDDASELAAIAARWNAVEVAAPAMAIPGVPKGRVLRIDTSLANPATLVANLRQFVDRPDGLQKVSSESALRLLAAAAEERTHGTIVGVNWVAPGADVTLAGISDQELIDGDPSPSVQDDWKTENGPAETSANTYDWANFGASVHGVTDAWELMFFADKLRPTVDVAIIDTGFSNTYQDQKSFQQLGCPSGSCANPFNCGGGSPCPWHGVHVANAGFGEPNNQWGGAGPGAEVSDLTLLWGFGDMGTLLISIPALVHGGEDIISMSNAIPVPDYLFYTTEPAEFVLKGARHVAGTLIFAAAGNENRNVDKLRCYTIPIIEEEVCAWEETVWFPCEASGVNCVGATRYPDKGRAGYSNHGRSVRFYATGTTLTGADPDTSIGSAYQVQHGTSFATPFMAGTAALVWAGNDDLGAGGVESCLSSARSGGPEGKFVNTYLAARCGLGPLATNVPPLVKITTPAEQMESYDSVGIISLTAEAADFESGAITYIVWSSDVEGAIGTSAPGAALLYQPTGPGLRTITATAFDPANSAIFGEDKVFLSFSPAPPQIEILAPEQGSDVILGLPTELIARVTNLQGFVTTQPCETATWSGFFDNSPAFDGLSGCSTFGVFPTTGDSYVQVTMSVDGVSSTATRAFDVVSDGQLHALIVSPMRGPDLRYQITNNQPATLSAASTNPSPDVTYTWTVSYINANGVLESPVAVLTGRDVTFTPSLAPISACSPVTALISLSVVDSWGRMADDEALVEIAGSAICDPD